MVGWPACASSSQELQGSSAPTSLEHLRVARPRGHPPRPPGTAVRARVAVGPRAGDLDRRRRSRTPTSWSTSPGPASPATRTQRSCRRGAREPGGDDARAGRGHRRGRAPAGLPRRQRHQLYGDHGGTPLTEESDSRGRRLPDAGRPGVAGRGRARVGGRCPRLRPAHRAGDGPHLVAAQAAAAALQARPRRPARHRRAVLPDHLAARLGRRGRLPRRVARRLGRVQPLLPADPDQRRVHRGPRPRRRSPRLPGRARRACSRSRPARWPRSCSARSTPVPPPSSGRATTSRTTTCARCCRRRSPDRAPPPPASPPPPAPGRAGGSRPGPPAAGTVWPTPLARPPTMRSVTTTLSGRPPARRTSSDSTWVRSPVTRRPAIGVAAQESHVRAPALDPAT